MACIFCGNNNVNYEEDIVLKTIISCSNCNGKYYLINNKIKNKCIIKYPKWNINPLFATCMLMILPFALLKYLIKNIYVQNILDILIIIFVFVPLIIMTIHFIQCIYNFVVNGFMISKGGVITKENSLSYIIFVFTINLISGIICIIIIVGFFIFIYKRYNLNIV